MKKKNYDYRRVSKHQSYSVQEIAELFDLHKQTVLRWLKDGLCTIDSHKPYLIYGEELQNFLRTKRVEQRRPCKPDEFYCCRCRKPRKLANNSAELTVLKSQKLRLQGKCQTCSCSVFRMTSPNHLGEISNLMAISCLAERHIVEGLLANVNVHLLEKDKL